MDINPSSKTSLQRIEQSILRDERLGDAISELERYEGIDGEIDALDKLKSDYELMREYFLRDFADPARQQVYQRLLREAYAIMQNLKLRKWLADPEVRIYTMTLSHYSFDEIYLRTQLEDFVQEATLLSLEQPDERKAKQKELYTHRNHIQQVAFLLIVFSKQWAHSVAQNMSELITSPTIDIVDALLLTSAVMLGATNVSDPEKVWTLMRIYQTASDTRLRQRALVGWLFALEGLHLHLFPTLRDELSKMLDNQETQKDIVECIMQVVFCLNTDDDNKKLRESIMPTLLKDSEIQMNSFGIKDSEEDTLNSILHPEADEEHAEKVEESIQKMMDMKSKGADIYFSGFSLMKRFPFFNTLSNWFVPFYLENPEIVGVPTALENSNLSETIASDAPFCDSDKYSFMLGVAGVFNKLPANLQEVMSSGGTFSMIHDDADTQSDVYVRRFYMQDLYRFYRLHNHHRAFHNPFNLDAAIRLLLTDVFVEKMDTSCRKLRRFLFKHNFQDQVSKLLARYGKPDNLDDLLMEPAIEILKGNEEAALKGFAKAYEKAPDDLNVVRSYAKAAFRAQNYSLAATLYFKLTQLNPDNKNTLLYYSIALLNDGQTKKALENLYRLNYEEPGNLDITRALAWGSVLDKNLKQAESLYDKLLAQPEPLDADLFNAALCKWAGNQHRKAVQLFVRYLKERKNKDNNSFYGQIKRETLFFSTYDITNTDVKLMADIVDSHLKNVG